MLNKKFAISSVFVNATLRCSLSWYVVETPFTLKSSQDVFAMLFFVLFYDWVVNIQKGENLNKKDNLVII
jgi:hypothetical protein